MLGLVMKGFSYSSRALASRVLEIISLRSRCIFVHVAFSHKKHSRSFFIHVIVCIDHHQCDLIAAFVDDTALEAAVVMGQTKRLSIDSHLTYPHPGSTGNGIQSTCRRS